MFPFLFVILKEMFVFKFDPQETGSWCSTSSPVLPCLLRRGRSLDAGSSSKLSAVIALELLTTAPKLTLPSERFSSWTHEPVPSLQMCDCPRLLLCGHQLLSERRHQLLAQPVALIAPTSRLACCLSSHQLENHHREI